MHVLQLARALIGYYIKAEDLFVKAGDRNESLIGPVIFFCRHWRPSFVRIRQNHTGCMQTILANESGSWRLMKHSIVWQTSRDWLPCFIFVRHCIALVWLKIGGGKFFRRLHKEGKKMSVYPIDWDGTMGESWHLGDRSLSFHRKKKANHSQLFYVSIICPCGHFQIFVFKCFAFSVMAENQYVVSLLKTGYFMVH